MLTMLSYRCNYSGHLAAMFYKSRPTQAGHFTVSCDRPCPGQSAVSDRGRCAQEGTMSGTGDDQEPTASTTTTYGNQPPTVNRQVRPPSTIRCPLFTDHDGGVAGSIELAPPGLTGPRQRSAEVTGGHNFSPHLTGDERLPTGDR